MQILFLNFICFFLITYVVKVQKNIFKIALFKSQKQKLKIKLDFFIYFVTTKLFFLSRN